MMTKTRTLTAVQPMLFLGECCNVTYTDRADWDAHHKTVHPSGKGLISPGWKSKPHIFSNADNRPAPIYKPTAKLPAITLTAVEKEWLGKEVDLSVGRWVQDDPKDYMSGRMTNVVTRGYVWSFGPNRTVSITVYDAEKGHNVLESGYVDNLILV